MSDVYLVGSAWQQVEQDTELQLDESVFATVSNALKSAGIARHQVGLTVISSLDLYDGRSISNALIAPAAAGYLNEEYRVEGDAMAATLFATAAIVAGQVDVAIVLAAQIPEIGAADEQKLRRFREKISSYTVDAHLNRPVGVTAEATLGMHASARVASGQADLSEMAARSADDITRGAQKRGARPAVSADAVASALRVVDPLTELMLPAPTMSVGALVLATGAVARRSPRPLARITGWGSATAPDTDSAGWLDSPAAATEAAARRAYEVAGISDAAREIDVLEMTDLSPALSAELLAALQLSSLPRDRVNPSGGVRSNYPGIVNGVLRVIEVAEAIKDGTATRGVAHTLDDLAGLPTSTASVLVMEEM
ncbi:hypothetical protein [Georgenia sp. SYP-B2076]|uniref:hypothetical protein n=1 Tax=Georgenia sp. SYP-B2076 TaxID=2495881 RepID=UPI000F8D9796|nr:hypothetical protein [Georgenia sp. SYP-B2076]